MSDMSQTITLMNGADRSPVQCELISGSSDDIIDMWDTTWKPIMLKTKAKLIQDRVPRDRWPQDMDWEWGEKLRSIDGILSHQSYCIVGNGKLQGLMIIDVSSKRCRLEPQKGLDLVYVNLLATAPWNRKTFGVVKEMRGVGTMLLQVAAQVSLNLEFKGRMGLHSLPHSEVFYRNSIGMVDAGFDSEKSMIYFELLEKGAEKFIYYQ